MIVGEIDDFDKKVSLEFIPIDEKEFVEIDVDITDVLSKEELIEKINEIDFEEENYIKVNLVGNRKIEIEPLEILKYVSNSNVIKLKDCSKLEIDLIAISKQNNLRGIFVKKLLDKKEKEPENKEKIEKAIEIGLASFE